MKEQGKGNEQKDQPDVWVVKKGKSKKKMYQILPNQRRWESQMRTLVRRRLKRQKVGRVGSVGGGGLDLLFLRAYK